MRCFVRPASRVCNREGFAASPSCLCTWQHFSLCPQVRHGGLLGVKYVVLIRPDMVDAMLEHVLPVITTGLGDAFDDVRSAAADALLPISAHVVARQDATVDSLLSILWSSLDDLDDLTVSTSSVMRLLAEVTHFATRALLYSLCPSAQSCTFVSRQPSTPTPPDFQPCARAARPSSTTSIQLTGPTHAHRIMHTAHLGRRCVGATRACAWWPHSKAVAVLQAHLVGRAACRAADLTAPSRCRECCGMAAWRT
jgi:hypothetical protein